LRVLGEAVATLANGCVRADSFGSQKTEDQQDLLWVEPTALSIL
jgi:hypothetical protein